MRVFAGPNGSGKSTIINEVRKTKVQGRSVDFGIYINADVIANDLRTDRFTFGQYKTNVTPQEFRKVALVSGLINAEFTEPQFSRSYSLDDNKIKLEQKNADERLAQILADFLRKRLLQEKKKFSFETVFSHASKLDIMREANQVGYKVYLYFVSTEDPEINKYRVDVRVKANGHYVDPEKITQRYYRSLNFLFEAAQLSYQAYFIDNSKESKEGEKSANWFAHFKLMKGKKRWDKIANEKEVPEWFKKYYSLKAVPSNY
jgi:predicted ABC-type ATPase